HPRRGWLHRAHFRAAERGLPAGPLSRTVMAIVRRALDDFRALGIVSLLLIPTEALHAQVLIGYLLGEKLSSPTFNMGFEVGINFATLDGLDGAERTTKSVFGLFAGWRLSEEFHLTIC